MVGSCPSVWVTFYALYWSEAPFFYIAYVELNILGIFDLLFWHRRPLGPSAITFTESFVLSWLESSRVNIVASDGGLPYSPDFVCCNSWRSFSTVESLRENPLIWARVGFLLSLGFSGLAGVWPSLVIVGASLGSAAHSGVLGVFYRTINDFDFFSMGSPNMERFELFYLNLRLKLPDPLALSISIA